MTNTLKDRVLHWKKKLERNSDERTTLNVICKLSEIPVTMDLLQETGIGKVMRKLSKQSGIVGDRASKVLSNWRAIVASSQKSDGNSKKNTKTKPVNMKKECLDDKICTENFREHAADISEKCYELKNSVKFEAKLKSNLNESSKLNSVNETVIHLKDDLKKNLKNKSSTVPYTGQKAGTSLVYLDHGESDKGRSNVLKSNACDAKYVACKKQLPSAKQKSMVEHSNSMEILKAHQSSVSPSSQSVCNLRKDGIGKFLEGECGKQMKNIKDGEKNFKVKLTEEFTASEVSFEDCLGFNDSVVFKRKRNSNKSVSNSSLKKVKTDKSTSVSHREENNRSNSEKKHFSQSLPGTEQTFNPMNMHSSLPQAQTYYRPLPQRKVDRYASNDKNMTNEETIKFTSSRKEKTSVYSGRKNYHPANVPTLFDCCTRVLIENIDIIEHMGGVPYFLVKQVLERCTPMQLLTIEQYNPYLVEDTLELWEILCKRAYRNHVRRESETWRDFYWRTFEERETKLKSITATISASMSKSNPARQVKLAFLDSAVKPPREVARRQAKHGTAHSGNQTVKAIPPSKSIPKLSTPTECVVRSQCNDDIFLKKTPKVAPLMAKTLKIMKQCWRRK